MTAALNRLLLAEDVCRQAVFLLAILNSTLTDEELARAEKLLDAILAWRACKEFKDGVVP